MNTFKDKKEEFSFIKDDFSKKNEHRNSIILKNGEIISRNKIVKSIRYLKETTALTNQGIADKLDLDSVTIVTEVLREIDQTVYDDLSSLTYSELIGKLYQRLNLLTAHSYKLLAKAPKTNYPVYMQAIKLAGERIGEEIKFLEKTKMLKEKQNPLEEIVQQAEKMTPTELKTKLEQAKLRVNALDLNNFEMLELEKEIQNTIEKKEEDPDEMSDKLFDIDS